MRRSILVYVFAWIVMTVYGGQVCPFLESLSIREWGFTLLVAFIVIYGLRGLLLARFGAPTEPNEVGGYSGLLQFTLEFLPFVVLGLGVAVFDSIYYDFPLVDSGVAAVLVGATLVGIFAAIDLSLEAERRIIVSLTAQSRSLARGRRFFPLTRKFAVLSSLLVLAMMTVALMVLSHDLTDSMSFAALQESGRARIVLLLEMGFVMLVFLLIVLDLIFTYSRNLRLLFENEIRALEQTDRGQLTGYVPVATNDEFGIIADYTNRMIESLRTRTEELQRTQDVTIHSLASLAETRDNETGAHLVRTQRYMCLLATELKDAWGLSEEDIDLLYKSAPLHDIGKVGIPDAILLKPGPLTAEEWVEMKRHTEYGTRALAEAEARLGTNSFLEVAREIIESHHERWAGGGYPRGIAGEAIPRSGRLMAIADVYDALISKRSYKEAFSHEQAREIIAAERGTHFDPEVADAFLRREDEFRRIAEQITDGTPAEEAERADPATRR
jgi:HD-GYP domain-containing protein (c-di-GMP phosphodiesterase class II)